MTKKPMEFAKLKVSKLASYALNSRVHSDKQIDQIAASINQFGFTAPIVVRSPKEGEKVYTIIAGHGRVEAAKRIGLDEVPTIVVTGWTDAQAKAYVIADNKLALNASWDIELLKVEMEAITADGFDIGITGFDMEEFKTLTGDWTAEATRTDNTTSSSAKARGKFTVSFDEVDREEVREALTNAIGELSVDNVDLS